MLRLRAGDIEADLPTSAVFQANTGHVTKLSGIFKKAEIAINSTKSRGSIACIDDALDNWHQNKNGLSPAVQGALYGVIKECQHWLKKKLDSKSKSTGARSDEVTVVRDLAWRNLKMLNPALVKMEENKAAFVAQTGRVPIGTATKSLHGIYGHERNLYVKSGKAQTYSASLLHELHSQNKKIGKDFDQLNQSEYEAISKIYRAAGQNLDMRYHNKLERSEFLLDIDSEGLLRKQDGQFFNGKPYAEIYAIDRYGNLFSTAYTRKHGQLNHSSFLAGQDVICAGCVCVSAGKLECIDTMSGHYKPTPENLSDAIRVLAAHGAIHDDTLAGVMVAGMDVPHFVNAIEFGKLADPNLFAALKKFAKPEYDWPK
jgi:hypothetical protein